VNAENSPSLTDKVFLSLNLAVLFVFSNVAFFYLYPVVLESMGAGNRVIGWVMGLFSMAAVLSRPLMGYLTAGWGEFPLMSRGIAVMLAATGCYPFIRDVGISLFSVRVIHGLGFSAFVAASFSAVAVLFPERSRGRAYGIVGAALMAAAALAPPAGEFLLERLGPMGLYCAAFGSILCAAICLRGASTGIPDAARDASLRGEGDHAFVKDLSFLFLLASTLIFAHCQSTVFNFIALTADHKGASAGIFFFTAFCLAIVILLTVGRWIDRIGKALFIRLFYPVFTLGLLLIPPLLDTGGGWVPALFFGAGMGFLFPAHNALASGYGGGEQKPAVMSIFTAVYDSGFITGAVFSGWVAGWTGLDKMFYFTGCIAVAGFLTILWFPMGKRQ